MSWRDLKSNFCLSNFECLRFGPKNGLEANGSMWKTQQTECIDVHLECM